MDNSPFNDDTLSAIIDGEADDATIASVAQDSSASARLEQLRAVSKLVASPVGDATPERRAASIAAAMKDAGSSPGLSSLAVRREAKRQAIRPQWFAAAAAVLLVLLALPLLRSLSQSDADSVATAGADTASNDDIASTTTTPAFATSRQSLSADEGRAARDTDDAMDDEAMDDELLGADGDASAGNASAAPTDGTEAPVADTANDDGAAQFDFFSSSYAEFNALLREGELEPVYSIDDPVIVANVSVACLEEFADVDGASFSLAQVQIDGLPRILLLRFTDDGVIDTLDASDCTPIG